MNLGANEHFRTRFAFIAATLLLVAAVFMLSGGTAVAHTSITEAAQQKLDPALQTIIAEQADQTIPIIVQKSGDTDQAEQLLAQLGGSISHTLPIINGFAANVSSEAILHLANSQAVAYVSLDAQVESSQTGSGLNLLENPGFESGFAGWDAYGNVSITGDAYSGANALQTDVGAH